MTLKRKLCRLIDDSLTIYDYLLTINFRKSKNIL